MNKELSNKAEVSEKLPWSMFDKYNPSTCTQLCEVAIRNEEGC